MKSKKIKYLPILGVLGLFLMGTAYAEKITFINDTAANIHLDWSSCEWVGGSQLDADGNFSNHSKIIYDCSEGQDLQFAQYSAGSVLGKIVPKCYINITKKRKENGQEILVPELSEDSNCRLNEENREAVLSWRSPDIDFVKVAGDINHIVTVFLTSQHSSETSLLPNVMHLKETISDYEDWQRAFSYDASRYPLWNGAYCIANSDSELCPKELLSNFMTSMKKSSPNAEISTSGYWAYTKGEHKDGDMVPGGSFDVKPALVGPIAVAELAVNGADSPYYKKLIEQLSSYDVGAFTPVSFSGHGYPNSSDPYFNGSLNLITEALLAGNGTFNLNEQDDREGYGSYKNFMSNYAKWNNSENGFVVPFAATDAEGKKHDALRIVFSVDRAPHDADKNNWENAGGAPTVSEGMSYGLLIAYAANDQASFDKLLNYVLFTSREHGCAGMNEKGTSCSIKTNYLMPWMVDETGRPFHYSNAGGYLTNGSATDADLNIVWALQLANERWEKPTEHLMEGKTYAELAQKMIKEMAFFDFNKNIEYAEKNYSALVSPGSQWGDNGRTQFYPGYDAPQAFEAMKAFSSN